MAKLLLNKYISKEKIYLAACFVMLAAYLSPYIYLGTDATLLIHDNLDSVFPWYKILLDSGTLFADNSYRISQLMNGIPRSCLPSEFDLMVVWFKIFGPYGAYVVNQILMRLVGFIGMYLFLKHHVIPGDSNMPIQFGVALCFSFLPFWPLGRLSVAGIPLVLYAYFNIREKNYAWYNWFIFLFYPVYSSLVHSGFFLLFTIGLLWVRDLFHKKVMLPALIALLLISLSYVFTHYRLFISFLLNSDFISHRVEFSSSGIGIIGALDEAKSIFTTGQYHALSLQKRVILPVVLFATFFLGKYAGKKTRGKYFFVLVFIVVTSLWYGILRVGLPPEGEPISLALTKVFPMQIGRFYFLHPALWMVLFAISLSTLLQISKKAIILIIVILIAQSFYEGSYHELLRNRKGPSFAAFYAQEQFESISDYIGRDKADYRIVSLGIHPVIAQYNGFYTLDAYLTNYPLSYKYQFRSVIAGELEKSEQLKKYYDNWGSRVYLISSELKERSGGMMSLAGNTFEISYLNINKTAFHDMGGSYILSAVRINEEHNPGILFEKKFITPGSAWDIYLYQVEL